MSSQMKWCGHNLSFHPPDQADQRCPYISETICLNRTWHKMFCQSFLSLLPWHRFVVPAPFSTALPNAIFDVRLWREIQTKTINVGALLQKWPVIVLTILQETKTIFLPDLCSNFISKQLCQDFKLLWTQRPETRQFSSYWKGLNSSVRAE